MKNKDELKKIALEISKFHGVYPYPTVDPVLLINAITEALCTVQDEALNSVLPSEEECLEYIQPITIGNEGVRTGMVVMHRWLRANMKPAPNELLKAQMITSWEENK